MAPPVATEARGKAYLFADAPAALDTMDRLTAGLVDYLGVLAEGIQATWQNPIFSPRVQNRLRASREGVERARREYPAMRVRSLAHAYEVAAGHPMAGRTREAAGTSTFVSELGNALNIFLVSAYAAAEHWEWTIARAGGAVDFRPRHAVTVSQTPVTLLAEYVALLQARGLEVPAADDSVLAEEARP